MSQSNFPPPQDFNADSFGQPAYGQPYYQEPPKRRGGRIAMFSCTGVLALIALCCCCCIGATVFFIRQPTAPVSYWGIYGTTLIKSWDSAEIAVCKGSQAETLTRQFKADNIYFTEFNAIDDASTDGVEASGTIEGYIGTWEATFILVDSTEGLFGKCIDRINVTNDPTQNGSPTTPGNTGAPSPTPPSGGSNS